MPTFPLSSTNSALNCWKRIDKLVNQQKLSSCFMHSTCCWYWEILYTSMWKTSAIANVPFSYLEIPYLLVYSSGVSLSIWLAIFGYQLTKAEIRKNEAINQEIVADSLKYSNPMPKMWKCIVINILSQVIGLARTIYFVSDP